MSPTHWLLVLAVLLLLFGAKRLPDMARSVGQSTRVLKGELRGLRNDDQLTENTRAPSSPPDSDPPNSRAAE